MSPRTPARRLGRALYSLGSAAGSFAALAASAPAWAEDATPWTLQEALGDPEGLDIHASARIRYEALENQFRPGLDRNDDLVSTQLRLALTYDTGPVRIGGELIDSRGYGSGSGGAVGTGEVNALELVQAYVGADLDDALGAGSRTSVDAGRFTLNLGSRRLVARNNFRNTTNAFTGARMVVATKGGGALNLFYTMPQQRLPEDKPSILDNRVKWDREGSELVFWGGFLSQPKLAKGVGLDLYFLTLDEADTDRKATRNRKLFTPGMRLFRDPATGTFDYEVEAAYQFGSIRASTAPDAASQAVSAHLLHAEVGRTFDGAWQPRVSLEYDLASGDAPGGRYTRFDGLYGARRPDFGPSSIYGPLGRSNLSSPGVRLEVKPSKRWDGFVMYRANWLDRAADSFANTGVRDAAGQSGKFAGHQIEARARTWLVPGMLRLDTGGAALLRGRFLKDAPNANGFGDTIYGYTDLTLEF